MNFSVHMNFIELCEYQTKYSNQMGKIKPVKSSESWKRKYGEKEFRRSDLSKKKPTVNNSIRNKEEKVLFVYYNKMQTNDKSKDVGVFGCALFRLYDFKYEEYANSLKLRENGASVSIGETYDLNNNGKLLYLNCVYPTLKWVVMDEKARKFTKEKDVYVIHFCFRTKESLEQLKEKPLVISFGKKTVNNY